LALLNLQANDTHEVSRVQGYHRTKDIRTNADANLKASPKRPQNFGISASPTSAHMSGVAEWPSPPETPELPENAIHVWRASQAIDSTALQRLQKTLADDERTRAERFIFERDRTRFVAARGILRDILGRYLQCAPETIEFVYGPRGKPAISKRDSGHPLCFNLSHSHGLALIGISRKREIGIDVELIRPEFAGEEIAKRYFSAKEIDELSRLPAELRTEGFFLCWTRKEAYIKARGDGLHIPLENFDVSLTPGLPAELNSADQSRWSLRSLTPEPGYVAAVIAEGDAWRLRQFSWNPSGAFPSPAS
jgi:4'-phosphopantetheinyl transferase